MLNGWNLHFFSNSSFEQKLVRCDLVLWHETHVSWRCRLQLTVFRNYLSTSITFVVWSMRKQFLKRYITLEHDYLLQYSGLVSNYSSFYNNIIPLSSASNNIRELELVLPVQLGQFCLSKFPAPSCAPLRTRFSPTLGLPWRSGLFHTNTLTLYLVPNVLAAKIAGFGN